MQEYNQFRRSGGSRIWKGLVLVIAGILLLAYKMGAPIPHWVFTWPMILVVIGFLSGIKSRFHNPGALIMIVIGLVFLADQADLHMHFHNFIVPAILIGVGIIYILKPKSLKVRNRDWRTHYYSDSRIPTNPIPEDDSAYSDISAVFGGIKKKILSKNF